MVSVTGTSDEGWYLARVPAGTRLLENRIMTALDALRQG